MAREKIIKKDNKCFVELPAEFMDKDEIELFSLREGYYLLSVQLPVSGSQKDKEIAKKDQLIPSTDEIAVLRKLQAIRFENRTPDQVNKLLSDPEKILLKEMGGKSWVRIFRGKKYKDGVYSISDKVYPLIQGKQTKKEEKEEPELKGDPNYSLLLAQGYLIIRDQKDAKLLSEKLKSEMKSGSVKGIKGFDGAFYVVTKDYFSKASKSILNSLAVESDVASITQNTKLEADAVAAVLHHLAESGDIIEKKRGIYVAI
jgi:hypothetical protein